jgi:hypothetical protein
MLYIKPSSLKVDNLASGGITLVGYLTLNIKLEGSNPTTGGGREKVVKKCSKLGPDNFYVFSSVKY